MSLSEASHPKSWAKFEMVIKKEFLPENERDCNWNAWDKCKMDGFTLVQHISKYHELILKLNGLDNFQRVRGFVHCLDKD